MINFIKRHKFLKNIILIILIIILRILIFFKRIYKIVKDNNVLVIIIIFLVFILGQMSLYKHYTSKAKDYDIVVKDKGMIAGPIDTFNVFKDVKTKENNFKKDIDDMIDILKISGVKVDTKDLKYNYDTYKKYEKIVKDNTNNIVEVYDNLAYLLTTYGDSYDTSKIKYLGNITEKNIIDKIDLLGQINKEYNKYFTDDNIQNILNNITDGLDISYYYSNPKNEKEFKNNEDEFFVAASTVKVGIATMISDMIKEGSLSEDTLEYFNKMDFEGGTGIIQEDPYYTQYTIKYLLEVMIKYSDNIATNILIRTAEEIKGKSYYQSYMENITNGGFNINGNLITANGAMNTIKNLYNNQEENEYYKKTINNMTQTEFNDRMSLYLPDNLIAHKIGGKENYFNDIGIVLTEDPYLFTSYCSEGYDTCNEAIGSLNLAFYFYHNFESINKK